MPPLPPSLAPPRARVAWRVGRFAALACALACALAAAPARAQEPGTIVGQVFDRDSGEPVADVTVVVLWPPPADGSPARQEVRSTDAEGAYRVEGVPAGVYSISFVKSGYRASKMTGFEVEAGSLNRADFPLAPTSPETAQGVLELEAFVVEAEVVDDIMNELELRMDSDQLLNILSAEDFAKFAASDVADALKRVSGVSVVEGQFAIIRGLEDRYSSNLYNSAPIPSPDPDSQSPQLDLFPSEVVSNLIVSKTFGPDQPGNSSGGSIDIVTHDYPEERLLFKLSAGTGFNDNAVPRFLEYLDQGAVGEDRKGLDDTVESDFSALLGGRSKLFGRELRFKVLGSREIDYETKEGFEEKREPDDRPPPPEDPIPGCQAGFIFVPGVGLVCQDEVVNFPTQLQNGELGLTGGRFELTQSKWEEQVTGYAGFGLDLDREGDHRVDASAFYTRKTLESVTLREDGVLPGFDFSTIDVDDIDPNADFDGFATQSAWIARTLRSSVADETPSRGPAYFANFSESRSFERERDLFVYQLNGDHRFDRWLEGLRITWAANHAETNQTEEFYGLRYTFEPAPELASAPDLPTDPASFPFGIDELTGAGPLCSATPGLDGLRNCFLANNGIFFSSNEITEEQDFARIDAELERDVFDWLRLTGSSGAWYEKADRDVQALFLPGGGGSAGGTSQFAINAEAAEKIGQQVFAPCANDGSCLDQDDGLFSGMRENPSQASREILAWHVGAKATLWDRVDLLAGVRRESIELLSFNDPFQAGEPPIFGVPRTFPSRFLLFDRLDNPANFGEIGGNNIPDEDTVFNDQLLGLDLTPNVACPTADRPERMCLDLSEADLRTLLNTRIDEQFFLPSYGFTIRPIEGLSLRGAYSRTVARPSFRELGSYVTVDPGTSDQVVGNPQLGLSEVESWDARAEYVWGDLGDLLAVSVFKKQIDQPIESIVLRDPLNADGGSTAQFRTFFNNPNRATLRGYEVEGRKNLGFLALGFLDRFDLRRPPFLKHLEVLRYLSVGGNYTGIDAKVGRTEAELARASEFFSPLAEGRFDGFEEERRLFGQPEWIVNADITFDHPDWGTKVTLAFFQISDILDSAGSSTLGPTGEVLGITLDRYVDSFHQLDLIVSQRRRFDLLRGDLTFKFSGKNLTDSTRRLIYDPDQTRERIAEQSFKVGRDYTFSISYELTF